MSSEEKAAAPKEGPAGKIQLGAPAPAAQPQQEQIRAARPFEHSAERVDPEELQVDAGYQGTHLRNKHPERRYVLVYDNGGQVSYFRNGGYVIEKYEQHDPGAGVYGVRLLMDDGPLDKDGPRSIGQNIEYQGHVLMSISKEKYNRIYQKGNSFMGGGQARFDELERQINSPNFDPVNLPGMRVKNLISDEVKRR